MTPNNPRLLVVDDNEDNRYTLVQRLKRLGYADVATALDGRQALAQLRERPFDLVLLDVMMPEMDGYQVLEHLRADARLRHVPVIMISAVDQLESVVRCIELGAEDYLAKPFNPTLLRARVGASLEKKRLRDAVAAALDRLERELRSAREVQLSMVPMGFPAPTPRRPVEIFATLEPAREIGGDLYDFFWGDDGRLNFVVADVSDKGAPAALFMARTKTALRLAATLAPAAPHEIVARVNAELCLDNRHGMFVTLFFGVLDPASGTFAFCNAGHNAPYIVSRASGAVPIRGPRGKPLGIRPTFAYETGEQRLAPDAGLFLFTDGVTEAMDAAGDFFTEERLETALRSLASEPAGAMVRGVVEAVRAFAGAAPQADDIAAMALRLAR